LAWRPTDSAALRPVLERDGPDDHLVVDGSQESADEGADPEDPLQGRKIDGLSSTPHYYSSLMIRLSIQQWIVQVVTVLHSSAWMVGCYSKPIIYISSFLSDEGKVGFHN
jgi:hypothetical protein